MRAQRSGVLAITASVVVLCTLTSAMVTGLAMLSESALRAGLVSAPAERSTVRVSVPYQAIHADPEHREIRKRLTRLLAPVGGQLIRTTESVAYDLPPGIGARKRDNAVFWSLRGAGSRLTLLAGSWPRDADVAAGRVPVAVPAPVAEHFDLRVGARFTVTSRLDDTRLALTVVGLWTVDTVSGNNTPSTAADAAGGWAGRPLLARGRVRGSELTTWGPLLVTTERFHSLATPVATVRWRAIPDWTNLTPELLDELEARANALNRRLHVAAEQRGYESSLQINNPLPKLLATHSRGLTVFRSLVLVPVALLCAVGACGLVLAASLLAAARGGEEELLRSRGASAMQLTRPAALEACVIGVLGAVVGPLLTGAVFAATTASESGVTVAGWAAGAVTAFGCVVALTIPSALRALRGRRQADSGRGTGTTQPRRRVLALRLFGLLVVVTLGAVAAAQLLRYGVSASAGGAVFGVDPLLVAAPAIVLFAATLLVVLGVVPVARMVAGASRRSRTLPMAFGSRAVARDVGKSVPLALLVALATGSAAFAMDQVAGQQAARDTRTAYITGGELRVRSPASVRRRGPYREWRALRAVDGVSSALPVYRSDGSLGDLAVDTLAVDAAGLDGTALEPGTTGWSPTPETVQRLRARPWHAGPRIPDGARRLAVDIETEVGTVTEVTPVLIDGRGMSYPVTGGGRSEAVTGAGDVSVRLAAVTVTIDTSKYCPSRTGSATVRLAGISAGGKQLTVQHDPRWWAPHERAFSSPRRAVRFTPCRGGVTQHLTLVFGAGGTEGRLAPIPAVVTNEVARALELEDGDTFRHAAFGHELTFRVVAVAPFFATLDAGEGGILVDAGTLVPRLVLAGTKPVPHGWWLTLTESAAPSTVARRVDELSGVAAEVVSRREVRERLTDNPASGGAGLGVALRLAAVAAVAVALLVLLSSALLRRRERVRQAGILRALGVRHRSVLASLGWEHLLTAVVGSLGGLVTGTLVTGIMLGPLTLGPDGRPLVPPPSLVVPVLPVAGIVLVLSTVPVLLVLLVTRLDLRRGLAEHTQEQA